MARFGELRPGLWPYRIETNFQRSRQLVRTATTSHVDSSSRSVGLTIIILNLDRPDLVQQLWQGIASLETLFKGGNIGFEVLLGDTGSTNTEVLRLYESAPSSTRIVTGLSYHFSQCNNELFEQARNQTILFLNNDVLIGENPQVVYDTYTEFISRHIDIAGAVLSFADRRIQHAGIEFFTDGSNFGLPFHPKAGMPYSQALTEPCSVMAVTGAFLMISSEMFMRAGGFDTRYEVECQDVDLCLKVHRLGGTTELHHSGFLIHLENATRPQGEEHWADRALFIRRWSSYLEALYL